MTIAQIYHSGLIGAHLPPAVTEIMDEKWILFGYLAYVLCALIPYLLGSINCGVILSKLKYHDDVRTHGSGNAGATNMLRTYGKGAAALTLGGDAFKALISCVFGTLLMGIGGAYIAGLFCVIGHAFPVYFRFKGGKGVVVTGVTVLWTAPILFLILIIIYATILFGTRFVSLASVMCALIYPLILSMIAGPGPHVLFAIVIAALVVFLHRENIKRIWEGRENKITFSKKKKPVSKDEEDTDED